MVCENGEGMAQKVLVPFANCGHYRMKLSDVG